MAGVKELGSGGRGERGKVNQRFLLSRALSEWTHREESLTNHARTVPVAVYELDYESQLSVTLGTSRSRMYGSMSRTVMGPPTAMKQPWDRRAEGQPCAII